MFDKNNNCSAKFNEELQESTAQLDRYLDSVLDPETGAEIVEHPVSGLSGEALTLALEEEAERMLAEALALQKEQSKISVPGIP